MAKDEHRKFRKCIFCNSELTGGENGTRSREHIFGKSLAEFVSHKTHWVVPTDFDSQFTAPFDNTPTTKGSSPITNITSRSVCKTCNGGFLREQLEDATPHLRSLINGSRFSFDPTAQEMVRLYLCRFAIIVDVETSNLDLELSTSELEEYAAKHGPLRYFDPTISRTERWQLKSSDFQANIRVLVGHHSGLLGKIIEFGVVPSINPFADIAEKRISLVIGNLSILLIIGMHDFVPPQSYIELCQPDAICWPKKPFVTYDDHYATYSQTEQIKWIRQCMRQRKQRRKIESNFNRTGIWKLPAPK
ncbi:hypothetical protein [Hyphococcus sp.]|uniref:hypothetical protein n=1 Tax=Hyphococcus sp. TaxID=2038636 RepID=UPI0035C7186D